MLSTRRGDPVEPELREPTPDHEGLLVWRWPAGIRSLSSAPVGGGLTRPAWTLNIGVPSEFHRTDLDAFAARTATNIALVGSGNTLFTAADVRRVCRGSHDGVVAHATVGISKPTWAADPEGGHETWTPGTINLVLQLPVALSEAAAVNLVVTATEAKTQALMEKRVPGTGTASDAVVIVWPESGGGEPFGGPRSRWGSRAATATYDAVSAGIPR
ncbi:MAG: adenosylcobinamide amidohydrolase [Actinomycetota bacterium]